MRHTTNGLSEDDLSRLTGSSSSTTSSGSSSSSTSSFSSAGNTPARKEDITDDGQKRRSPDKSAKKLNNKKNNKVNNSGNQGPATRFSSTYLPEFINPLEWQKSRKRKERLDSTSSSAQDRKLQRSSSEEVLPQDAQGSAVKEAEGSGVEGDAAALKSNRNADIVIRRVSSEDFKKTSSYALREQDCSDPPEERRKPESGRDENDASAANRQQASNESVGASGRKEEWVSSCGPTKDMRRRSRYETSPMRSQRHSPLRSNGGNGNGNGNGNANGNGKLRDSDESECEHERRRSSERFCKTRAPPGRKAAGVTKKSGSGGSGGRYLSSRRCDENVYKYDLSVLKHERRGFISKKAGSAEKVASSDFNDNNLIDFHQKEKATGVPPASPVGSVGSDDAGSTSPNNVSKESGKIYAATSAQESLPWDRTVPEDQAPILSRRYAAVRHRPCESIEFTAKLSKVMPYPQVHKQQGPGVKMLGEDMDMEPMDTMRAFSSLENTCDVMKQVIPVMMSFQSPEERLKQVNKRLTAMKKKLAQLEEAYEDRMGYRPSQADRLSDRYMKNVVSEISKLRKERHELKADPMGALGVKVSGDMDADLKLGNMKATLQEIEKNLADKRKDFDRSVSLDDLTPDQLVQEKSAVQHGLLYFESQYGRPSTKDERDAARSLYDRYRHLKRLVSRSVMLSGGVASGAPELPTILEHEAMVFESTPLQLSSNNSTDSSRSHSESIAPNVSSEDSTTTTTGILAQDTKKTTASAAPLSPPTRVADANFNISDLSIEELWEQLEKMREEKKMLKRTIREFETVFEEQNGRKMLKNDRKTIEETYAQYKERKAKTRLLQALIKKHISR